MAARPHGSNSTNGDWSVSPHEPYWQTNTSFSPPPSRWDFHFQPEHDGIQLCGSSTSDSKGSKRWMRGNLVYNHQYQTSEGAGLLLSSSSDFSQGPQWTPPAIQEISADDYDPSTSRGKLIIIFVPFYFRHYLMADFFLFGRFLCNDIYKVIPQFCLIL